MGKLCRRGSLTVAFFAFTAWTATLSLTLKAARGADSPVKRLRDAIVGPEEPTAFTYRTIGESSGFEGVSVLKVEGIGVVTGLAGTGGDPPPSGYRERMIDIMKKKEINAPTDLLKSDTTALVLLRAFIPPGARKGDMIDVEVWVPPGDSTTSLRGGWLLQAEMFENMLVGKTSLEGDRKLIVEGPVLVLENPSDKEDTASLRKGKILGQGRVLHDRDFHLVLSKEERSKDRTKKLSTRINQRFFENRTGQKSGMAAAKTDKVIAIRLAKPYRYDILRYLLVMRRIPLSGADTFFQWAFESLKDELKNPNKTFEAALRLEAIGPPAIPTLKEGLHSDSSTVRFASAQALAYLGDPSGAGELGQLAETNAEFRSYALAALVAMDHPMSRMQLTRLLSSESAQVRYGAFRALWSFDQYDPIIEGASMKGEFDLHVIDSEASPMVHISRNFRREVVLFNGKQRLYPPLSLRAGPFVLLNASSEGDRILLARYKAGKNGVDEKHAESSFLLADVIVAAANLGATYADIGEMLQQASANGNLEARLEVNALPVAPDLMTLSQIAVEDERAGLSAKRTGEGPGLFAVSGEKETTGGRIIPTAADESEEETTKEPPKRRWFDFMRRRSAN